MKPLVLIILLFIFSQNIFSQSSTVHNLDLTFPSSISDNYESTICSDWSIDIPSSTWGISFGNSTNFNGFRFNYRDCDVETVNGFNFTL